MSKLALPRLHTCCEVISLTPHGGSIAFETHDTMYSVCEQNDSSHSFVLSWRVRLCLAIRPESVTCGGFYNSDLLCTHFRLAEVWYGKQEVRAVEKGFPVESMTNVVQTTLGTPARLWMTASAHRSLAGLCRTRMRFAVRHEIYPPAVRLYRGSTKGYTFAPEAVLQAR